MTRLIGRPPSPMTCSTMTGLLAATGTAEDLLDDDPADHAATVADDLLADDLLAGDLGLIEDPEPNRQPTRATVCCTGSPENYLRLAKIQNADSASPGGFRKPCPQPVQQPVQQNVQKRGISVHFSAF